MANNDTHQQKEMSRDTHTNTLAKRKRERERERGGGRERGGRKSTTTNGLLYHSHYDNLTHTQYKERKRGRMEIEKGVGETTKKTRQIAFKLFENKSTQRTKKQVPLHAVL